MRVLHLIPNVKKEGPVDALLNLLSASSKTHRHILCYNIADENYLNDFVEIIDETIKYSSFKELYHLLNKSHFEILHTHTTRGLIYSLLTKKLRIHSCQVIIGYQAFAMNGYLKGFLVNITNKILLNYQSGLIFSSTAVETSTNLFKTIPTTLVYNSVSKEILPEKRGSYYVIASRLSKEKNIEEAISFFLNSNSSFTLYIMGKGPEEGRLKYLFKDFDQIKFLGFVKDYESKIANSRGMISSSITEGLPITVLKALAYGKPVLISDIPPHLELLEGNGHLYRLGNQNDFSSGLLRIENEYNEMRLKSIDLYHSKFSPNISIKKYELFITRLLA
jgi:glycosyltransferase involved in cell wall biosynthesis